MNTASPSTDPNHDAAGSDADPAPASAAAADPALAARLRALEAELLAMPPVAALGLRVAGFDGTYLRLRAPLAANVNDKGCAFGGSLTSLMTLTGWGLATLRLRQAGLAAEVYVAHSDVHYRAPLYADLVAEARPDDGESWSRFFDTLRSSGRARIGIAAAVALPDGGVACDLRARFVAIARAMPATAAGDGASDDRMTDDRVTDEGKTDEGGPTR